MNSGTVLAIVILCAYMGIEIFAFKRASHRTEPTYIRTMLIETRTAIEFCEIDVAEYSERFDRTLARVSNKLREELEDKEPAAKALDIDRRIAEQENIAQQRIRESLTSADCTSQMMKDHLARYRIYAKKSR